MKLKSEVQILKNLDKEELKDEELNIEDTKKESSDTENLKKSSTDLLYIKIIKDRLCFIEESLKVISNAFDHLNLINEDYD